MFYLNLYFFANVEKFSKHLDITYVEQLINGFDYFLMKTLTKNISLRDMLRIWNRNKHFIIVCGIEKIYLSQIFTSPIHNNYRLAGRCLRVTDSKWFQSRREHNRVLGHNVKFW